MFAKCQMKILCLLLLASVSLVRCHFLVTPTSSEDTTVQQYGNWCGSGHGGYQDCCGGKPCDSCRLPAPRGNATSGGDRHCASGYGEDWSECRPSRECLQQCPPVDSMDLACAYHDECCFVNDLAEKDPSMTCSPGGNYCWCDCHFVRRLDDINCPTMMCAGYRKLALYVFKNALSCWYYQNAGNFTEIKCNGVLNGGPSVDTFCKECDPQASVY